MITPLFNRDVRQPNARLPIGAWDTAAHVYGSATKYPSISSPKAYRVPTDATIETLSRMHDIFGISRGVLVQPTSYGLDHRALLDALRKTEGRYVGVALVTDEVDDKTLDHLESNGVRGARFNIVEYVPSPMRADELCRQLARVEERGWSAALHVDIPSLLSLEPVLDTISCRVSIDHMAYLDSSYKNQKEGMSILGELLRRPNWWIRLSCADRRSAQERNYTDMIDLMRTLYEAAPTRALWGTDWPHASYKKHVMADDSDLVELLCKVFPVEKELQAVLVDNPERMYASKERRNRRSEEAPTPDRS